MWLLSDFDSGGEIVFALPVIIIFIIMLIKNYYYEKEKKRLIPIIKREKEQNLAQHIKKMQEKGIDVSINFTPKNK